MRSEAHTPWTLKTRDSKDFSLPAPGVSGETPALTSGALSSPWAPGRKAGGNPRKSTSDDFGPTPLPNPVTPPAPDSVIFAGTWRSSQARCRCSPAEVRDSVEVAVPRRDRRRPKCAESTFRTNAAIPDFAQRLVFTLHQRRVHIPKDLVKDYKREDDIYLWFKGYESALHMNLVPEAYWGAALWKHFEVEGRDTLTALRDAQDLTYTIMKDALLTRYGLTPEQYKDKFRSYKKKESQMWLECVDSFCWPLDGWVKGSKVTTYEGLYNLIAWEQLYSLCFPELRQHLIDSKLIDPRKLAQEADRWESTRVQKRYGGDHAKGGQGPSQKKEGEKKPWFSKGKPVAGGSPHKCYACDQVGHVKGDPKCPKSTPAHTAAPSQGLASVALDEELVSGGWEPAEITLVSLGDSEMVQRSLVPENIKKYRKWVTINGQKVEALRDTGDSVTTVRSQLVSEE
ncbi:hypothetical protein NDU88_001145 [Pleurodeles waltl]|uniref:Uncharacterized protein n=1 Tax=Pleurodeles waltl TaxID=8319 RepID=A0AAV7Q8X2_PLEWA|nr:hypothetical protein NDU88_001145 [Pleurodeles waltl]